MPKPFKKRPEPLPAPVPEIWWPRVYDERETIKKVLQGFSLARLGDGELSHLDGRTGGRQVAHPDLTLEMRLLVCDPDPMCIVGIPTMDPKGPKYRHWSEEKQEWHGWHRHKARFSQKLSTKVRYYSAFVTRPDSAPWIDNREFCQYFERVWSGKRVTIVEKVGGKVAPVLRLTASEVTVIRCPLPHAYAEIDSLQRAVSESKCEVALLSCGPTATVLANRLASQGVQAIDIGSAGAFLWRHLGKE